LSRPRRIATTLAVLVATTLVIGLGAEAWVSSRAYEAELLREALSGLHRLSDTLQRSMRYAMLHDDRPAIAHAIRTVGAGDVIEHVRLLNKDGRVRASSREPEVGQRVDTSDVACTPCHGEGQSPRSRVTPEERSAIFTGADGGRRFQVVEPVINERACSTAGCHVHSADQQVLGVLTITTSLAHLDAGIAAFRWRTLAVSLFVIALVTGLVLLVLRRLVSTRIRRLLEGTRRVASGDLSYRIPDLGGDEFGVLAESFNRMTTTLSETRGQLLQSERLASLGRMSAGVAHEINNPLTGVLLFSSAMLDELPSDDPHRENVSLIVSETTRCRDIIRGLLDFSRQTPTSTQPARIADVVAQAVAIVRTQASVAHVEIDFVPPERCSVPPLEMDPKQIQQVVLNLLLNAVDAMPEGGRVTIRCQEVGEGMAELTIADTGSGIPPEHLSRLFEPFFSTKGNRGTGLGLAIAWGIVEQHGGTITVTSTVGEGTTFAIRLPLAKQEA